MISTVNSIENNAQYILSNTDKPREAESKGKESFSNVFEKTLYGVKFSKHASKRLDERNLNLTEEQAKRLNDGVIKAGKKGIRDSLMIMDSMALIVNIPSNTVVTAINKDESVDKIFTNIDGAVII